MLTAIVKQQTRFSVGPEFSPEEPALPAPACCGSLSKGTAENIPGHGPGHLHQFCEITLWFSRRHFQPFAELRDMARELTTRSAVPPSAPPRPHAAPGSPMPAALPGPAATLPRTASPGPRA